jgi:hypothetical protein
LSPGANILHQGAIAPTASASSSRTCSLRQGRRSGRGACRAGSPPPLPGSICVASGRDSPDPGQRSKEGGRLPRDGNGYIPIGYDLPIPTPTIGKTPHHPYPSPTTGLKFPHTHHPSGSGYLAGDPYPLHYNCS